ARDALLMRPDARLELGQQRLSPPAEHQGMRAAVVRRRHAPHKVARLQAIDDGDDGRAVDAEDAAELALAEAGIGGNDLQHAEPPGRDAEGLHPCAKIEEYRDLRLAQPVAEQLREDAETPAFPLRRGRGDGPPAC